MVDIIPGRRFLEQDIELIEYGSYTEKGNQVFAIQISLRGRQKPIIAKYRLEMEMCSALSQIEKKWAEATGQNREESMLDQYAKMQERIEETEKQLAKWEKLALEGKRPPAQKNKKRTSKQDANTPENVSALLADSSMSQEAKEKLEEWLEYKRERKEPYVQKGLQTLITMTENKEKKFGTQIVSDTITESMSSGYKGIAWKAIRPGKPAKGNQFTEFEQNEYTDDELNEIIGQPD